MTRGNTQLIGKNTAGFVKFGDAVFFGIYVCSTLINIAYDMIMAVKLIHEHVTLKTSPIVFRENLLLWILWMEVFIEQKWHQR